MIRFTYSVFVCYTVSNVMRYATLFDDIAVVILWQHQLTLQGRPHTPAHIEPRQWKQADNTLMLIQMVSANLGVAALPNWAIDDFAKQGLINSKPLEQGLWRRLFAAVREADKKKPYLQAFFATAKEQCQHHLADIKTTSIHK